MTTVPDTLSLPLFPLPKLVFFPKTTLPLHVFESRYINLVTDIVAGDRLLGLPQLKPGFEPKYLAEPDIYSVFGYGEITWWEKNAKGEYDILIRGRGTGRLITETLSERGYRQAEIRILPLSTPLDAAEQSSWLQRMRENYLPLLPIYAKLSDELRGNLTKLDSAEQLCNIVSMNFIADEQKRQALLEKSDLKARMIFLEQCIASETLNAGAQSQQKN